MDQGNRSPGSHFTTEWGCPVPEGVAVYRLPETGTLYLKTEENGVTVTPWKGTERRTR